MSDAVSDAVSGSECDAVSDAVRTRLDTQSRTTDAASDAVSSRLALTACSGGYIDPPDAVGSVVDAVGDDGSDELFAAVIADYLAGAPLRTLVWPTRSWTTVAGLTCTFRDGVLVARNPAGRVVHALDTNPKPVLSAAWAIVRDSKGMTETGHGAVVRWARVYVKPDDVERPRASIRTGHACGWAADVDGTWRCVQDFYAVGDAPETGCGATWP